MKNLSRGMLCMLLIFTGASSAFAQTGEKQRMFASMPQTVSLDRGTLSNSFDYTTGSEVSVSLSPGFTFSGTVLSNRRRSEDTKTVMIRNTSNMILQISEVTDNNKTVSYVGRIVGSNAADGYEIKNNNGQYSMQKFDMASIFEPCGGE